MTPRIFSMMLQEYNLLGETENVSFSTQIKNNHFKDVWLLELPAMCSVPRSKQVLGRFAFCYYYVGVYCDHFSNCACFVMRLVDVVEQVKGVVHDQCHLCDCWSTKALNIFGSKYTKVRHVPVLRRPKYEQNFNPLHGQHLENVQGSTWYLFKKTCWQTDKLSIFNNFWSP